MNAIAEELALGKYDIVCLQEVWSENDFIHIKKLTHNVLPYSHYFYRYVKRAGKNKGLSVHSSMQHLPNFVIRYYQMEHMQ
jgi:mRNA deadenylase 3'-5' endonuclease subunit Ccr4